MGATLVGVDGFPVEVEVRLSSQLPRVDIVGMPEAAVRESAARVRAAIAATGHRFPERRITVSLAPAALRKSGAALDLPIAVAILAAASAFEPAALERLAFAGELALDGRLRDVRGSLALGLAARDAGARAIVLPPGSAAQAALADGIDALPAPSLRDVVAHLLGVERLAPAPRPHLAGPRDDGAGCVSEVRGQATARRALVVAAAGGHGLLLSGPPGSGKTMLARRLPSLLPAMRPDEALEATRVHGAAGLLEPDRPIVAGRPFRAPHHSASAAGMLGGGSPLRPGEVSLAHCGVLMLDELPEFDRRVLEALREVMEERRIRLSRAAASCTFPARFQLVAACNPCPCGWYRSGVRDCRCDDGALARYRRRLSGPLLDRIDLHVAIQPVAWGELDAEAEPGATSRELRTLVARAREAAAARGAACNADVPDRALDDAARATPDARQLLGRAVERLGLSARGARRAIRVARTCADLAGDARVGPAAMAEALSYRVDADDPAPR